MNKTVLWTMLASIVALAAWGIGQFGVDKPDVLIGQEKTSRTVRTTTQHQTTTSIPSIRNEQKLFLPKEVSKPSPLPFDTIEPVELSPVQEEMGVVQDMSEFIDADTETPPQELESEEPAQDIGPFIDADEGIQ